MEGCALDALSGKSLWLIVVAAIVYPLGTLNLRITWSRPSWHILGSRIAHIRTSLQRTQSLLYHSCLALTILHAAIQPQPQHQSRRRWIIPIGLPAVGGFVVIAKQQIARLQAQRMA